VPASTRQLRLLVLLLPEPLEEFSLRPLAEDLLRTPGVVAVDPPRATYARLSRVPELLAIGLASRQAQRLRRKLPGVIGAVALFHPAQYPLARSLTVLDDGSELWYGTLWRPAGGEGEQKLADLDHMARERATFLFEAHEGPAVWQRLSEMDPTT
jgi:hypothetical protein